MLFNNFGQTPENWKYVQKYMWSIKNLLNKIRNKGQRVRITWKNS